MLKTNARKTLYSYTSLEYWDKDVSDQI